jgi:gamma-glutamyltranspeptidase/glutathione hydrolase
MNLKFFFLLFVPLFAAHIRAESHSQARSMVISRHGIVASEHPLASQIGAKILDQGGNAIDAAIAANAAMGLLGPMANGIGGDLFAIVYEAKTGKLYGLNASGWAPAALTPQFLHNQGFLKMPQTNIHSITVPGAVDGWTKLLERFGRKKLSELLAPSIQYAEEGFPVSEIFASYWAGSEKRLRGDHNAEKLFLPAGRAPRVGEIFRNPDLAWSYRQIARHGRKAFYQGEISKRILACSTHLGGTMTAEDLAKFSSEWVEPISTSYRGWRV